jgi:hypothetical protein
MSTDDTAIVPVIKRDHFVLSYIDGYTVLIGATTREDLQLGALLTSAARLLGSLDGNEECIAEVLEVMNPGS